MSLAPGFAAVTAENYAVSSQTATTGHTKSCGCYNRDHVKNDLAKYRPIAWAKRKQQFFEGTSISAIVVGKKGKQTSMSGIRGVTPIA